MSLIIFFGFCAIFLTVSTIYVALTLRHHYKISKLGKNFAPPVVADKNDALS